MRTSGSNLCNRETNKQSACPVHSPFLFPGSLDKSHSRTAFNRRALSLIVEMFKANPLQAGDCHNRGQLSHEATVSQTWGQLLRLFQIIGTANETDEIEFMVCSFVAMEPEVSYFTYNRCPPGPQDNTSRLEKRVSRWYCSLWCISFSPSRMFWSEDGLDCVF